MVFRRFFFFFLIIREWLHILGAGGHIQVTFEKIPDDRETDKNPQKTKYQKKKKNVIIFFLIIISFNFFFKNINL